MKFKLSDESGKITLYSVLEKLWWDGDRWVGYPPDTKWEVVDDKNQEPAQSLKDGQG